MIIVVLVFSQQNYVTWWNTPKCTCYLQTEHACECACVCHHV